MRVPHLPRTRRVTEEVETPVLFLPLGSRRTSDRKTGGSRRGVLVTVQPGFVPVPSLLET